MYVYSVHSLFSPLTKCTWLLLKRSKTKKSVCALVAWRAGGFYSGNTAQKRAHTFPTDISLRRAAEQGKSVGLVLLI